MVETVTPFVKKNGVESSVLPRPLTPEELQAAKKWIDKIDIRLGDMEDSVDDIDNRLMDLESKVEDLEYTDVQSKVDDFEYRIEDTESAFEALRSDMMETAASVDKIVVLFKRLAQELDSK